MPVYYPLGHKPYKYTNRISGKKREEDDHAKASFSIVWRDWPSIYNLKDEHI